MARARNIKPGFFANEELVEADFGTRLLFIGLWTIADRAGRLEDRPKRIKMQLFPADDLDVELALCWLHGHRFIERYRVDDAGYIQIINFEKHQYPHKNESASTIPAPEEHSASTVQVPEQHDATPPYKPIRPSRPIRPSTDISESSNNNTARAREEPPPPDIQGIYEETLNGAMSTAVKKFSSIDKQFTEGWLRAALLAAEVAVGPLSRSQLGQGIDLTIDQVRRAAEAGKVHSPRAFAQKLLIDYLTEQKDSHHAA